MITIELEGLQETIDAIRAFPTSIDRRTVFEDVAETFADRLRASTPLGYSGKLKDSVVYKATNESSEVGYESGVETAGNTVLDGIKRPVTRGRSVLRVWVKASDLESVMEETFSAFADEAVTMMEEAFSDGIS